MRRGGGIQDYSGYQIHGSRVIMSCREPQQSADLNGDGDTSDDVLVIVKLE